MIICSEPTPYNPGKPLESIDQFGLEAVNKQLIARIDEMGLMGSTAYTKHDTPRVDEMTLIAQEAGANSICCVISFNEYKEILSTIQELKTKNFFKNENIERILEIIKHNTQDYRTITSSFAEYVGYPDNRIIDGNMIDSSSFYFCICFLTEPEIVEIQEALESQKNLNDAHYEVMDKVLSVLGSSER